MEGRMGLITLHQTCGNAFQAIRGTPTQKKFLPYIKSAYSNNLNNLNKELVSANVARKRALSKTFWKRLVSDLSSSVLASSCRFVPIGSYANGLSFGKSDLDLVFFPIDPSMRSKFFKDFHANSHFKYQFMSQLSDTISYFILEKGGVVENTVILPHFRVPLLILYMKDGFRIDIQFPDHNFQAVRNTYLIRYYTQCDQRMVLLVIWLRTLFDALNIRQSAQGLLSMYHIILLIIHFLQNEKYLIPSVLPVLCKSHPDLFGNDIPIDSIIERLDKPSVDLGWKSNNSMMASELAVRLIDYYSAFDPSRSAIFIEHGVEIQRKQRSIEPQLKLIDPYSPVTVCRSTNATKALTTAVTFVKEYMFNGMFIDTFPDFPEASIFRERTENASWRLTS